MRKNKFGLIIYSIKSSDKETYTIDTLYTLVFLF